jgi:DnaJ-class molecular chaperone
VLLGLPGKPEYMVAASTPAATNSDPNGSACQVCLQVLFEGDADIYMCEKCKGCGHFVRVQSVALVWRLAPTFCHGLNVPGMPWLGKTAS